MPNLLNRKTVKSQVYTFAATTSFQVPVQFLEPAMSGMRNPKIRRLRARVSIVANTGTQGGPARQFAQVFSRVLIQDGAGDRVNIKGSSLRVINYAERTGSYRDGLNIAASATNAAQDVWLDLLPSATLINEQGEDDHGILVSDIFNGGQIQLTWGNATTFANYITWQATTQVELYADIVDAVSAKGLIELPPRHCYTDEQIALTDARYKVGGLLRWLIVYNGDQGEDTMQGLATQNVYSDDLRVNGWALSYFADSYRTRALRAVDGDAAGVIQTEDPFLRPSPQAFALFQPELGQSIASLPPADTIQYRTTAANVGTLAPVMIKCFYTKRAPQLEMAALQAPDTATSSSWIVGKGMVSGSGQSAASVSGGMAPFLPLEVAVA